MLTRLVIAPLSLCNSKVVTYYASPFELPTGEDNDEPLSFAKFQMYNNPYESPLIKYWESCVRHIEVIFFLIKIKFWVSLTYAIEFFSIFTSTQFLIFLKSTNIYFSFHMLCKQNFLYSPQLNSKSETMLEYFWSHT